MYRRQELTLALTYQSAFRQDPDALQANILMGTLKTEINIPLLGYEFLWEAVYEAADTGDYSKLQDVLAGYSVGFAAARLKQCPILQRGSAPAAPDTPTQNLDTAAEAIEEFLGGEGRIIK